VEAANLWDKQLPPPTIRRNTMKKLLLFLVSIICFTALPALAGDVKLMTATELKNMLGSKELVILDVRSGRDWSTSELKITGAIRANGDDFDSWANSYPKEKKIVLYCAWPNEGTSAGLAQQLMGNGYTKVYALKGGWKEWQRQKFPVEPKWSITGKLLNLEGPVWIHTDKHHCPSEEISKSGGQWHIPRAKIKLSSSHILHEKKILIVNISPVHLAWKLV
jgi:rhodanese-related sulfurtransferase